MLQTMNRILKSDEVEIEGRCQLDIGHAISPAQHSRSGNIVAAKAKILDNNNEYAMIELTCACGRKTLVRCDYGNVSAPANAQPNGTAGVKRN
jgi:hypothetical protein